METLKSWYEKLSRTPLTIECVRMRIIAKDPEADVFVGVGQVHINGPESITFKMYASLPDLHHTLHCIHRARANPYDALCQFRLLAEDFEGNEWNGGWITPQYQENSASVWLITGSLRNLTTMVEEPGVSTKSSVEVLFTPLPEVPLSEDMLTVSSIAGEEQVRSFHPARHRMEVMGSEIEFRVVDDNSLSVSAQTGSTLTHPFLENWLGEPLRILFGQLIYPRLTARNFGNGQAFISVLVAPKPRSSPQWIGLWKDGTQADETQFWTLYSELLTFIAVARSADGYPNLQSNAITRFYEEASQATFGSRWVLCMTLASTAEGLTRLLLPLIPSSDFSVDEVQQLKKSIQDWDGNPQLKSRVIGWFARIGETGASQQMRLLEKQGILSKGNIDAWNRVRNVVMHGELVSPWSTRKEDEQILQLADLIHRLTRALIKT